MQLETMAGEKLWGAPSIAQFMGVSIDTVYKWALDPDTPVFKAGGRYFALKRELRSWLRQKPSPAHA